jgi:hypothetical protein
MFPSYLYDRRTPFSRYCLSPSGYWDANSIFQILRDELWITELLKSTQWEPDYEHPHMNESYVAIGVQDAGEEEINLDSLLNGDVFSAQG